MVAPYMEANNSATDGILGHLLLKGIQLNPRAAESFMEEKDG